MRLTSLKLQIVCVLLDTGETRGKTSQSVVALTRSNTFSNIF